MSDLISRKKVLGIITSRLNSSKIGSLENQRLYSISEEIKKIPAAFDLESVIEQLEEKLMQVRREDIMLTLDIAGSGLRPPRLSELQGIIATLETCLEILKSAANATNEKNGG